MSDTLGEGTTENVVMILSGYSSRILEMRSVPMPEKYGVSCEKLKIISKICLSCLTLSRTVHEIKTKENNSSLFLPEPVPPPREWVSWNPWRQSQLSASLRTTSRTESTSSAPSV